MLSLVSMNSLKTGAKRRQERSSAEISLKAHYWEMLHNASLYSHVYGPVRVSDDLPYYCDGRQLVISGYALDRYSGPLNERVSRLIRRAKVEHGREMHAIEFWGPTLPTENAIPQRMKISWRQEPRESNRDVILKLDAQTSWANLSKRRDVKRALRNHLRIELCTSNQISEVHETIVSIFLRTHEYDNEKLIDLEEKKYVTCWRAALAQQDSLLINVFQQDRLVGFVILSLFGSATATYAYGFFDNSVAGTSDLAHATMISLCRDKGFHFLDLGHSIHKNLLRYKQKWGQTDLVPAPWCVRWTQV